MLSQYYKEVDFSVLFSAINEVNILQDPVTETLSQPCWLTVQEYWGTKVRVGSGWIIKLGLKNTSYCRTIMKMLFQNISPMLIGLRNSSQDWSSFGRCLTGRQSLSDHLSSWQIQMEICCGFVSICNKEPHSYSLTPHPSPVGWGGDAEGKRQNSWTGMRTV